MGADKQNSKSGGGYVGGLLQLFDWNAKSRKKLFSSKADFPEQSKQKKRHDGNFPVTRLHLMDEDEIVARRSIKGSSDYSYASSVTDEEVHGIKAPGLVARLMGLDALPSSDFTEPYSTPFFGTQSLKESHYRTKSFDCHYDNQSIHSGNLHYMCEVPGRAAMEPKQKLITKPIEKFQTEVLPPKSAKSIPITHHKLLSPIKSANFIPSKNAAYIMEAASRIIEPGPATNAKAKMPLLGSSSVPLRVKDLKEKVEATQKALKVSEASRKQGEYAANYLKGQAVSKGWNSSTDSTPFRISESSVGVPNNGKSISLALQAKANVQKREGLSSRSNRILVGQKETSETNSSLLLKSQPGSQNKTHKRPTTDSGSNVLRQNNQKQNCGPDKGKTPSKPFAFNSQGRKTTSGDSSSARPKSSSRISTNSKTVTRKTGPELGNKKKEVSCSNSKNITRKRRPMEGIELEKNSDGDDTGLDKREKIIQSTGLRNHHAIRAEESVKKGTDVVSFTFTAPITRSAPGSETPRGTRESSRGFHEDCRGKRMLLSSDGINYSKTNFLSHNTMGGDDLSKLLEQKLRELTRGVESSPDKAGTGGPSSVIQNFMPGASDSSTPTILYEKRYHRHQMHANSLLSQAGSHFSSIEPLGPFTTHRTLGMDEEMKDHGRKDAAKRMFDHRLPSPISVFEHSLFTESCNSSDTTDSISTKGMKQSSSVQAQEVLGTTNLKTFLSMEADAELSDSASSTSSKSATCSNHVTSLSVSGPTDSKGWELEFVRNILCNVDLMFNDFAMGKTSEILNPRLFYQLEGQNGVVIGSGDASEHKLRRKVIFDCVNECIDLRCKQYMAGGCRTFTKGLSVLKRKERLSEEVYKEILAWSGMGDCMVDELVDKDMSSQYGRWLDFEIEAFELGVQIENRLLNSLIDEVVTDLLVL